MDVKKFGLKSWGTVIAAAALAASLLAGGICAYFTDTQSAANTFTFGSVDIDLTEPGWDPGGDGGDDEDTEEKIVPNQTITKDPRITNTGSSSAFVFMEISVPYANVVTADLSGNTSQAEDTELFFYEVNEGWAQIDCIKDEESMTVTHIYVYGTEDECTVLAAGETTVSVFDSVTAANIISGQGLEDTMLEIVVTGYAIQSEDLTVSGSGETSPEAVWSIISDQMNEEA